MLLLFAEMTETEQLLSGTTSAKQTVRHREDNANTDKVCHT